MVIAKRFVGRTIITSCTLYLGNLILDVCPNEIITVHIPYAEAALRQKCDAQSEEE